MNQNKNNNYSMAGTLAITGITICATALGWTIAKRIRFVRGYWKTCKAESLTDAHGVKCSSWLAGGGDSNADAGDAVPLSTASWFRVNDVIMGGRSTSELSTDEKGRLVFSGNLSTVGGGFVSVRTTEDCPVRIRNPEGVSSVRVSLSGDGQLWKVNLGTSHSLLSADPTWSHDVPTESDALTTHTLRLSDFTATKRGRPVKGAVLDPSAVCYAGLILSLYTQTGEANPRFGDGPFRVVLHELEFV